MDDIDHAVKTMRKKRACEEEVNHAPPEGGGFVSG